MNTFESRLNLNAFESGKQQWREMEQSLAFDEFIGRDPLEAEAKAVRMAQKLAPEMQVFRSLGGMLVTRKVRPGGVMAIADYAGLSFFGPYLCGGTVEIIGNQIRLPEETFMSRRECCSNTFMGGGVPPLERALTYYLHWKLFPQRFAARPLYPHDQQSRLGASYLAGRPAVLAARTLTFLGGRR